MEKEFIYDFKGFWETFSRCKIKLLHHDGGPLIILCSQTKEVIGTSVCNAHEILRKGLEEKLKSENRWKMIDGFRELYEKHNSLPVASISFVLRAISNKLRNKKTWYKILTEAKNIIWIEHWPKDLCISGEDEYFVVEWDGENEPSWKDIDIEIYNSTVVGYPEGELKITS